MFTHLPDLAAERLGGAVLAANDEFFAPKEAMLKPTKPEWREGVYTERGKWMDGWETRRRREPGYDWAIVRLGLPGLVRGVVIDTSYFTGNYPEEASIDACTLSGTPSTALLTGAEVEWLPLLAPSKLAGNAANQIEVSSDRRVTHLRLNIFPDGGVARLRVHGEAMPDPSMFAGNREVDLAAIENGGHVIDCSDMHYGNPQQLLMPGRSTHMGDGWETKRRRGPGHDWTIIQLARRGTIERIELDTDHYKGNAPGRVMLESADVPNLDAFEATSAEWRQAVPEQAVEPHARHRFDDLKVGAATHLRLNIYPDGGVARLRVFGRVTP